jgi:hypothetical protein
MSNDGLEKLADYLEKNRTDCLNVLKVCANIGKDFNSRSDRFIKSEIMDITYAKLSEIEYVDEVGYDLLFDGYRISSKGQESVFCKKKPMTRDIALTNTRDDKKNREKDFDLLIITQTKPPMAIAICTYEACLKNKKVTSDQIKTRIEYDDLKFIIHPSESILFEKDKTDLKRYKRAFINLIIRKSLGIE